MSTLPHGPQPSLTTEDVDAWLLATKARRAQLHIHAASPLDSDERQEAFTGMSVLLEQACEEIGVLNEMLGQRSATACQEARTLVESSATSREKPCLQTSPRDSIAVRFPIT